MADDDFVPLRRYVDPVQAEMAGDFLRDAGIPVVVSGQHGNTLVFPARMIEVVVSVPKDKIDAAREVLEALDNGQPSGPLPGSKSGG